MGYQLNNSLLIVDDEPETLEGYKQFLTPTIASPVKRSSRINTESASSTPTANTTGPEFELLLASSGEQALSLVQDRLKAGGQIAAGFFDVKMPGGMDGITTIREILKLDSSLRFSVVTAYHDRTVDELNTVFGENFKDQWDYLNKPFTQGEIVQKARQMVSAWNSEQREKILHAQLVKSERLAAIGQVARGVGHEFGNILLRIMGKTDLALMEQDVDKIKAHLQVVMSASDRASVIVRNLQSFTKSGPKYIEGYVSDALDEALSLINHEFIKFSVKIAKDFKSIPKVRIDMGGMGQVFLNLLINAVHAMPSGGEIKLTVTPLNGGVSVWVTDTGVGIPSDVLPRIFEFAFTTKGDRGSGLGLSISKEIVESHGGTIEVKTEENKGTQFEIWLPGLDVGQVIK